MANNTLEVSLALKSKGYRAEIQNIKKDNQLLRAEFKNLASTVDNFEDSLEGKQARLKLVTKEYENAKKMIEVYKNELKRSKELLEESNQTFKAQEEAIKSTKLQIEDYKNAFGPTSVVVQTLEKDLEELEKQFKIQANAVVSANAHYKETQLQLTNTETKLNELGKELKECAAGVYNFDGKLNGLESQLREVEEELDSVGQATLDFGAKMSQIGQGLKSVGDSLTNLGQKGINAISTLVQKGSEWNSEMAQTEMVYGNLGEATQKAIDDQVKLASTFGFSEAQMKSATTEIASYYKAMNIADDAIADMLPSQAQLIADMAAFADVDIATALGDYKSALQGNHNAVDKYNIAIGESTINESDYAKSIGKSLLQMTEQEKVQARINVMMQHSADYTGLARQEADEFTMKLKALNTKIDEGAKKIGETLLPVLEPLIGIISDVVDKIVAWVEENPQLTAAILSIVGAISTLFVVMGPIFSLLGNVAIVFGALSTAAAGAGTSVLGIIGSSLLPLITTIGSIIAIVAIVSLAIKENWEGIQQATNHLIEVCSPYFEQLKESFSRLWETCQSIYESVIQPLFRMIGEVIEVCIELSAPLFNLLMGVFSRMIDSFVNSWNTWGKPLFDTLMFVVQTVFDFLEPIFLAIADIFGDVVDTMFSFYDNTLEPMFETFMDIVGKVIEVVRPIFEGIRDSITEALQTVNRAIESTIGWFKDLFGWINDGLGKVGNFLSSLNPFKSQSMEINASLNTRSLAIPSLQGLSTDLAINPLNDVALSGSYYTSRTPLSEGLSKLSRAPGGGLSSQSVMPTITMQQDYSQLSSILEEYLGQFVQAMANFNPNLQVNLNGHKVSDELNEINGQGMRLNERWK